MRISIAFLLLSIFTEAHAATFYFDKFKAVLNGDLVEVSQDDVSYIAKDFTTKNGALHYQNVISISGFTPDESHLMDGISQRTGPGNRWRLNFVKDNLIYHVNGTVQGNMFQCKSVSTYHINYAGAPIAKQELSLKFESIKEILEYNFAQDT